MRLAWCAEMIYSNRLDKVHAGRTRDRALQCKGAEAKGEREGGSPPIQVPLLDFLLWTQVVGVTTLLLAAVDGTRVQAGVAPG